MDRDLIIRLVIVGVIFALVALVYIFSDTQCEWGRIPICVNIF